MVRAPSNTHLKGESRNPANRVTQAPLEVDTFDGKIFVEWDPDAAVTSMGQLPFFIEFLKLGGCFDRFVSSSPLTYKSANGPKIRDVLGSLFLSILSGHKRFSHMSALFNDQVNSKLLGMSKIVSDDSARRGVKRIPEDSGIAWLQNHLQYSYEPLLEIPWILDVDTTVKPLYGNQEGAVVGYNPHKPGRPSHTYHTYIMANLRLVLDVEVQAGNQSNAAYSMPGLLELLNRLPVNGQPVFIRGDCDFGSEPTMYSLEVIEMPYLFKLRQSKYVKALIQASQSKTGWVKCKGNMEAIEESLKLGTWTTDRRVIITRKPTKKPSSVKALGNEENRQQALDFIDSNECSELYEYAVLVTTLSDDLITIAHHYCDRADCENLFDEMKNQWGWGGFSTQDIKSCRLMARMIGLVYNWWSLFVRTINADDEGADGHQEAITTRPVLLTSIGRLTESGRQQKITISSQHSKHPAVIKLYQNANAFFNRLKNYAPQLSSPECWKLLLSRAVEKILGKQSESQQCFLPNTT